MGDSCKPARCARLRYRSRACGSASLGISRSRSAVWPSSPRRCVLCSRARVRSPLQERSGAIVQRSAPYEWQCLGCSEPNAAVRTQCVRCVCPAYADARQIEFAQEQLRSHRPAEAPPATTSATTRDAAVFRVLGAGFLAVGWLLSSYAAPPFVFAFGILATLVAVLLWWLGAQASNPSIERTSSSTLGVLPAAAHVER